MTFLDVCIGNRGRVMQCDGYMHAIDGEVDDGCCGLVRGDADGDDPVNP